MKREVRIETRTVGQCFGTCAVLLDETTREKRAETETRPYQFDSAARSDGETFAAQQGWKVLP